MANFRSAFPLCFTTSNTLDEGTLCLACSPVPAIFQGLPEDMLDWCVDPPTAADLVKPSLQPTAADRKAVSELAVSDKATNLLLAIEELRLKPYDDQTGKDITAWVAGATIGYGHLIPKGEWDTYKDGITAEAARALYEQKFPRYVKKIQSTITVKLLQQEFDALFLLTYNFGSVPHSAGMLINDPKAKTPYKGLESAWKAVNRSEGKVNKGLINRRKCEWDIYTLNVYQLW